MTENNHDRLVRKEPEQTTQDNGPEVSRDVLEKELKKILDIPIMTGLRGMNNPNDPREVQAAIDYKQSLAGWLNRANEISFQLHVLDTGINPEEYEPVRVSERGTYSTSDIFIDGYAPQLNKIQRVPNGLVFRRKDAPSAPKEGVWKESSQWWKLAEEFSRIPTEMIDPISWLTDLKDMREKMGDDTSRFDAAIAEIEGVVNGEIELPDEQISEISESAGQDGGNGDVSSEDEPIQNIAEDEDRNVPIPDGVDDILTVVKDFGHWPKTKQQLREALESIIESQRSLSHMGRDASKYEEMLGRLDSIE